MAAAPLLLGALAYHPYPEDPDGAAVASATTADTARWFISHFAVGVAGFALGVLGSRVLGKRSTQLSS